MQRTPSVFHSWGARNAPSGKSTLSLIRTHIPSLHPSLQGARSQRERVNGQLRAAACSLAWCGLSTPGWVGWVGIRMGVGQAAALHLLGWAHLPDLQLQALLSQKDHVCYIKKAFFLAQDIMEDTISFKDNTSNAIALVKLQELSVQLEDCFPQVYEEQQETVGGPGARSRSLGQGRGRLWWSPPSHMHRAITSLTHPTARVLSFIAPSIHLC